MSRKLNRRAFLKIVGTGALAAPSLSSLGMFAGRAFAQQTDPILADAAMTPAEMVADIRAQLEPLFAGKEMGLDFRRYTTEGELDFRIEINEDERYPVASAFKAWLVLYYFLTVPREEWAYTPDDTVYRVAVFSNNSETGRLLYRVSEYVEGDKNPIEKFNDFVTDVIGIEHGLFAWNWPNTPTAGFRDERYQPGPDRSIDIYDKVMEISNVSTAEDLAHGWEFIALAEQNPRWETDEQFREAIRITRELLAIPAWGYLSPIEQVVSSGYVGKDGTLPQGDLPVGRVINDAGLMRVPSGFYLLSFMSTGENESSTRPALQLCIDSMRRYEAAFHPAGTQFVTGVSRAVYPEQYNYGFVRRQEVPLYSAPSLDAERVDNPVRRNTVFGLMYLMQGAMVRFWPVDDEWGRIVRDDQYDTSFTYDDWTSGFADSNWMHSVAPEVYIRLEDLLIIGYEHAEALGWVTGAPEGTDKYIILDVPRRQLMLFEGINPVIKTPIVLNIDQTPRGRFYIHRMFFTRNMPNYPGVPYTNFLHDGNDLHTIGYAIHGAPWHRWNETVTRRETLRRYSHGCINIPNWSMQITEDINMPVDEFIFRWSGGFPDPAGELYYLPQQNVVRVYSHNNIYQEVFNYPSPDSVRLSGYNWGDVLELFDATDLSAPESFFEPTLL